MLTNIRSTRVRTRHALLAGLVGSLVLITASAAGAGTGEVTLISTSSAGVVGNAGVLPLFSMSDDGSKVTFDSQSTNLVSPASSGRQAFVKDIPSGVLTIVSARADGTYANGASFNTAISHNGRYVTFNSQASNLDPGHPQTSSAVYMKDLATGALTLVSSGVGPAPVSDDGRTVVFQSGGIVAKDLESGTVTALAGNPSGTIFASISADGSKVAIASMEPLLPNDTDSGRADVYVRDMTTGSLILASTRLSAGSSDSETENAYFPYLSANGDRVAFQADGFWDPCPPCTQVYVKDLGSNTLIPVSRRADGVRANALSQDIRISGDGRFAAFSSNATNLDPADLDSGGDAYLKNLDTGELTLVSISDGGTKGNSPTFFASVANNGGSVVFSTASSHLDPNNPNLFGQENLFRKVFPPPAPVDANGDGIIDSLQPAGTPFGSFVDNTTSPPTTGSIVNANGLTVTITDAPDQVDGVLVTVGPGTGTQRATISACGMTQRPYHDSTLVLTCGSTIVKTITGLVEVALDGNLTIVSIPAGASAEVTDTPNGVLVANVAGGNVTVLVDGVSTDVTPGSPPREINSWDFTGFAQPVDNSTSPTIVLNSVKAGRAVPLKWRVTTQDGSSMVTLVTALVSVENFECGLAATTDEIEQTAAGESGLQNLGNGNYQLNWKTGTAWAGSCKVMHLDLGDGVKHDAYFKFTR